MKQDIDHWPNEPAVSPFRGCAVAALAVAIAGVLMVALVVLLVALVAL